MKKKLVMCVAGLVAAFGVAAAVEYPSYADERCQEEMQSAEEAYGDMFMLTGDQQESFDYRAEQRSRALQSRWCS